MADRFGIGGNNPPTLAEELSEETTALVTRATELVICADERSEVVDDDTAARAVQLLGQMKDLVEEIERARVDRKEPFLASGRIVDTHFHTIMDPLAGPEPKKKLMGAAGDLLARIDAWRRQKEAEAEIERQRLAEEARRLEEAARRRPMTEHAAVVELDQAARLRFQAAQTVATPINSGVGPRTSVRRFWKTEITDLSLAIDYCLKNGYEASLQAAVQLIYDKLVFGKSGARTLPGATIKEHTSTGILRK